VEVLVQAYYVYLTGIPKAKIPQTVGNV